MMTIGITTGMMNTGITSITVTGTVSEATGVTTIKSMNSSESARSQLKKALEGNLLFPATHTAIPEMPHEQLLVRRFRCRARTFHEQYGLEVLGDLCSVRYR